MAEAERFVSKILIQGTIEAVWHELTKTDEVQKCMFDMQLHSDLQVGSPIRMRTKNGKYTGVVGKILEFDPPHRYSHTFRFTAYDDPECVVTYELHEVEGGVEVTLISDRVPGDSKTAKQMRGGGDFILKTLKAVIEKGKPSFGTRVLYGFFKLMAPFTPKKCKSENWR